VRRPKKRRGVTGRRSSAAAATEGEGTARPRLAIGDSSTSGGFAGATSPIGRRNGLADFMTRRTGSMSSSAAWNSRDRKPKGLPSGSRSSVDGAAALDPSRIARALEPRDILLSPNAHIRVSCVSCALLHFRKINGRCSCRILARLTAGLGNGSPPQATRSAGAGMAGCSPSSQRRRGGGGQCIAPAVALAGMRHGPERVCLRSHCCALQATCHAHTRLLQGTFSTRIRVIYLRQRRSLRCARTHGCRTLRLRSDAEC
jgi:hypothetical protein